MYMVHTLHKEEKIVNIQRISSPCLLRKEGGWGDEYMG
jgi:hypothetical protein